MQAQDFLVELGTEELPPKALKKLAEAFLAGVEGGLKDAGLGYAKARYYAAPRRLAVLVEALATQQPDRTTQLDGPPVQAAFDADGNPTKAAEGFARKCGVSLDEIDQSGPKLRFVQNIPGQPATDLLPGIVDAALAALPIPKRMRWGARKTEFVRPTQWLVMLLGDQVVPCEILSQRAGNLSRGHRFHHPDQVTIASPAAYAETLRSAHVIADFAERREIIKSRVDTLAAEQQGTAIVPADLLDEVTALVEWPVAISGSIDERFMNMPPEVLITTIESHQRYFPVRDAAGGLLPRFVTVANVESLDMSQVIAGNERVVRPRLDDALFFWNKDRKQPLADYVQRLDDVTFQKGLGSYADKTKRLEALASSLADSLGADAQQARRAATLSKADLVTDMVFEFTELEGLVGGYYARESGEPEAVAAAIAEHYQPRGPSDAIPATPIGRALALADKFDTLAGQFALGNRPSGDRDPLGLRRAALGVLRILLEARISLDLLTASQAAIAAQPAPVKDDDTANALLGFFQDRLRGLLAEQGVSPDVFEAVAALELTDPLDIQARCQAVLAFRPTPAAASLAAAHKRVRNILKKSPPDAGNIDPALFDADAERAMLDTLDGLGEAVASQVAAGDYAQALERLASLQAPVDQVFEDVMVMADDDAVRRNRLRLLARLDVLLRQVADFSHLSG